MAIFLKTLALGMLITGLIAAIGYVLGSDGHEGAPTTSTGDAIAKFLKEIPSVFDTLPQAAVVALVGGLTVGGVSYNMTPNNLFSHFQVDTVALAAAIPGAAQGSASTGIVPNVLYSPGAGPNGTDVVYMVTPGADGKSTIDMFAMDSNGFVVGTKGPDSSYLPMFQPKIVNGKVTGIQKNPGALNAIMQIPACLAIANDTLKTAQKREADLETCMRTNHAVNYVPIPNPT